MDLTSSSDFETPAEHRLAAGEQLDLQAGGQINLEHPQWFLKVNSGDSDAGALGETRQRLSRQLADRLEALGFSTVDQGVAARSTLADAERVPGMTPAALALLAGRLARRGGFE